MPMLTSNGVVKAVAIVLLIGFFQPSNSVAYDGKREDAQLKSVTIRVIGMTFSGLRYQKRAEISYGETGYSVTYRYSRSPFRIDLSKVQPACSREVDGNLNLGKIMRLLGELRDHGENAKCCDHPWTEVQLDYFSRPAKKITLVYDFLKHKEMKLVAECLAKSTS